jgi:hypothetical protein
VAIEWTTWPANSSNPVARRTLPWLTDVRTLALAEACDRLGETEREQLLLTEFVVRQGLLFEPNRALTFGFVQYQERVRSVFWQTLTNRGQPERL